MLCVINIVNNLEIDVIVYSFKYKICIYLVSKSKILKVYYETSQFLQISPHEL